MNSFVTFHHFSNLLPTLKFNPVVIEAWLFKQDASVELALLPLFRDKFVVVISILFVALAGYGFVLGYTIDISVCSLFKHLVGRLQLCQVLTKLFILDKLLLLVAEKDRLGKQMYENLL